ncbi:hypothetical protein ISN45_Aa03g035220 [Arabidopsis thaliana x Arabidopsis arenosa]|uniref:Uncharacterized protein n=1 Tax=Arabidopsis thaliana x Arabidopsis arenosa TaxID=1240361 RepID=A0A8T2AZ13_9BRAS|nr:hypothetical protein ISN45_Aa03g035220 [Arabidopsis thaliana x Arabidopsis arenosa]
MASCDPKGDVVLTMIARTKKNLEEFGEIFKKVDHINKGTEFDVGFARRIEKIDKNVKEASQYYSYLEKEKAADDTFVSDEVMERLKDFDSVSIGLNSLLKQEWN